MSTESFTTLIKTNQYYYAINPQDRFHGMSRLLDMFSDKQNLIFCRTKRDVDHLTEKLDLLNYKVTSYHGDLTPAAREKSLLKFANREVDHILLTDVPSEMSDVKDIGLVLFSMIPQDPDSYVQRVLRLESMLSIEEVATLITPNEFKKLAFIQRMTNSDIEQKSFISIPDIIAQKKDEMISYLSNLNLEDCPNDYVEFAEKILNEVDAKVALVGLIETGFKRLYNENYYKKLSQSNNNSMTESGSERLFIALGKTDGIDADALIDFLNTETNISREFFSEIKIFDTFSFFVVPSADAEVILEIFKRKKRGKRSIVERAKGAKDQQKKTNKK